MQMTGAEVMVKCLAEQGVSTVFGYPGGAILPFYDALREAADIRHILTAHEQGAAHAADGYARAGGQVGVCIATSGPGATNLVTGLANAFFRFDTCRSDYRPGAGGNDRTRRISGSRYHRYHHADHQT